MTRKEILDKALSCVNGDRDEQYGNPEDSFRMIAELWMTYLGNVGAVSTVSFDGPYAVNAQFHIRPQDVAAMLALLKIARIAGKQAKDDNWIDLAGYAACGGEIESNASSEEV